MATNIGTDEGSMPANVSDSDRATVTAGFAKLVDDVNQYAPAIHAATANGTTRARPVRTHPWITSRRPTVATTSESHSAPDERSFVESSTSGRSNIALATTAPMQPPTTWATRYSAASRVDVVPN